jgi:tRNA/rRNA methyltransferase
MPVLDPTPRFILVEISHPGNVGAVARALKVMGFGDLVLVRPRYADVLSCEETVAMASGAADVLTRARVVDRLEDALDGVQLLCATAMTPRDFGPPTAAPRAFFEALLDRGWPGALGVAIEAKPPGFPGAPRVGFMLGSERYGLSNDDVYRAHMCLSIPTHPSYGSLNLAQAAQLLAYEYRQALGGFNGQDRRRAAQWADAQAVAGVLLHWQQVLQAVGFLDPQAPKKLMPRLQQLLNRTPLTQEEVHILRGMARAVERAAGLDSGSLSAAPGTLKISARTTLE